MQVTQAIWDQLVKALTDWINGISNLATVGVQQDLTTLINWLKSVNFVTTLPPALIDTLVSQIGLADLLALLNATTATALLFAAVGFAGHYALGWPVIGDSVQRIGVGIILVKSSQQLTDWSIMLANALTVGIASALPSVPVVPPGGNPILLAILEAYWVFLLLRVVIDAGKLIVWLMILKPVAGLAFLTWMHSKSGWIASKWVGLWIGLLIGHFMLVLGLSGAIILVTLGGFSGFILSAAALIVAREALYLFVPSGGDPLFKVGPVKVG